MDKHAFYLVPALALTGCFSLGSPTPELFFDDCGQSCKAEDWVFASGGAHTTASTTSGTFRGVRSSDPSIMTALVHQPADGGALSGGLAKVELFSGNPGTVTISLVDEMDHVLSTHTATVVPTTALEVNRLDGPGVPEAATILENTQQVLHVTTKSDGKTTRGDGAVQFAFSGMAKPAYVALEGDSVGFSGAAGDGAIVATCSDVTVTQPVTFVPLSAVTGLDAAAFAPGEDGKIGVLVGAHGDAGKIYAGACAWSGMDPSVTLESQSPASIDFAPSSWSTFTMTRPGTFDVTCVMAGHSTTVTITRAQ